MGVGGEIVKVCVLGLWHLGTVTAACLATSGHHVMGLDFDEENIQGLQKGRPPIFEPGLEEEVKKGIREGRLKFTTSISEAVRGAQIVWVAYDTPVDDQDRADVAFVVDRVKRLFTYLEAGTLVLISSQLPVGSTRELEKDYVELFPAKEISFAYSPENLRLGKAIQVFTQPDRIVVGVRFEKDKERLSELLKPFAHRIEWMSVESAEMTKHALNAFLALSVTFANEIAVLCEKVVGADAKEVERGLKSESRIGPRAYLSPGAAFAGGTLARDVMFLNQLGRQHGVSTRLLDGVRLSNDEHRGWVRRQLRSYLGDLKGKPVCVWGLTYKPGTNTLRRSSSVELCEWLFEEGALIRAHDPAVKILPEDLSRKVKLWGTPVEAARGAYALVVATEWPDYQTVALNEVSRVMAQHLVIDPSRFLENAFRNDSRFRYVTVGAPLLDKPFDVKV